MKKLMMFLGFLLIVSYSFGQATAVEETRVAADTTNFRVNYPIGTKIYCIADSTYWVLTAPALSTEDLNSAGCIQLNPDEVDGSITNEGKLTVEAGGANTAEIHSNTSTSTDVTISGGGIAAVTEDIGTGTITITATEVDGSTTNELQTLANTSDATTHTTTLSNSGGSTQFVEGTGITLATTGTGLNGIVTIAANAGALGITTDIVQWVEVAADDLTLPYPVTMAQTPAGTTQISMQLNGQPVKYAAGTTPGTFNFTGTALSIYVPVYQYDKIEIRYSY